MTPFIKVVISGIIAKLEIKTWGVILMKWLWRWRYKGLVQDPYQWKMVMHPKHGSLDQSLLSILLPGHFLIETQSLPMQLSVCKELICENSKSHTTSMNNYIKICLKHQVSVPQMPWSTVSHCQMSWKRHVLLNPESVDRWQEFSVFRWIFYPHWAGR